MRRSDDALEAALAPHDPHPAASVVALFRYAVVSEVLVGVLRGQVRREAVRQVAGRVHLGPDGRPREVGVRSIYRWLAAFQASGLAGLEPVARSRSSSSDVLEPALLTFLADEKEADGRASIPECQGAPRLIHLGAAKLIL